MNYGELKTETQAYLGNRTDISTARLDLAAERVRRRVNDMGRFADMVGTASLAATAGIASLPADFIQAIGVTDDQGRPLAPVSAYELARYASGSGSATVYSIGASVTLYPANTASYTLTYFAGYQAADLDSDGDTVPHPNMWLAGMLSDLGMYIQNGDLAAVWEARFREAVDTENRRYQMQHRAIGRGAYDYSTRARGL